MILYYNLETEHAEDYSELFWRQSLNQLKQFLLDKKPADDILNELNSKIISLEVKIDEQNYFYRVIIKDSKIINEVFEKNSKPIFVRRLDISETIDSILKIKQLTKSCITLPNINKLKSVQTFLDYIEKLNPENCLLPESCFDKDVFKVKTTLRF